MAETESIEPTQEPIEPRKRGRPPGARIDKGVKELLSENEAKIARKFLASLTDDKISPKLMELGLKVLDKLNPDKEESSGVSPDEYIRAGIILRQNLREEYESCGVCPVCKQPKALRQELRLSAEPEHKEGGEVAALGLSD